MNHVSPFHPKPLQLDELLATIKLAAERGYSVKAAQDMKSEYNAVMSDLYAVWYAIENEISVFIDNISHLIESIGWKRAGSCGSADDSVQFVFVSPVADGY